MRSRVPEPEFFEKLEREWASFWRSIPEFFKRTLFWWHGGSSKDSAQRLVLAILIKTVYADGMKTKGEQVVIDEFLGRKLLLQGPAKLDAQRFMHSVATNKIPISRYIDLFFKNYGSSKGLVDTLFDVVLMAVQADGLVCADEKRVIDLLMSASSYSAEDVERIRRFRKSLDDWEAAREAKWDSYRKAGWEGKQHEGYRGKRAADHASSSSRGNDAHEGKSRWQDPFGYQGQQHSSSSGYTQKASWGYCHYEVLGCKPTDSDKDIRRAYHRLAKQYHPDTLAAEGKSDEMKEYAAERFLLIQSAFEEICAQRDGG